MTLVAKISAQEKIAELEGRIAKLEDRLKKIENLKVHVRETVAEETQVDGGIFGVHWDNMWREFDLVMKRAFSR